MNTESANTRLHVVDALRGFAIVSIMLLHNIEHFDFYYTAEKIPLWMQSLDSGIWEGMFFLFSGKSYAMFALLFGLTFYIQSNNQHKRGQSFKGRFAWRMFLLLLFGTVNSAFYQGDILTIYAVIGLCLIPLENLNNRIILWIAIILFLRPFAWVEIVRHIASPELSLPAPSYRPYFHHMHEYIPESSLWNTMVGNLKYGKIGVILWSIHKGRISLILSLFLFGMIAGRKALFVPGKTTNQFWKKAQLISAIAFVVLYTFTLFSDQLIETVNTQKLIYRLVKSWSNTIFMVVLVSTFTLLFHNTKFRKALNYFTAFGKMSLTNYVFQSIIGASIYHGFGLGLYKYTGATYAILIGLTLTIIMGYFCKWWSKHYKRGPLETLWHKATWIKI